MATELKVPSLGMDMEEAKILRWLVEEGAEVEKGDPVLEIETDKTSFEVEAPADGIIGGLRGEEGESLPVGATLAFVAAPGEEAPSGASEPPQEVPPAKLEPGVTVEDGDAPDGVAGNGSRNGGATPVGGVPESAVVSGNGRRLRASPAARRAAMEAGVSLEEVAGSGPMGRVYLSDVLAAVEVQPEATRPAPPIVERPAASTSER
jgi:pyruvate dehydrogenase E2 component (dihydrolipoamide acetyltransferase)